MPVVLTTKLSSHCERLQILAATLPDCVTAAECAAAILRECLLALNARAGSIALLSEDASTLEVLADHGYPEEIVAPWRRFSAAAPLPLSQAARTGQPLFIASRAEWTKRYPHLAVGPHAAQDGARVALPLRARHRTFAVLGLSFTEARAFSAKERRTLEHLAAQCAFALDRALLTEKQTMRRHEAGASASPKDSLLPGVLNLTDVAALIDHGGDAMVALDSEWRYTFVSHSAERLLNRTAAELLGGTVWDLFPHIAYTPVYTHYQCAMTQRTVQEFEIYSESLSRWLEQRCLPTADGGLLILFRDISDRKRRETALQESARIIQESEQRLRKSEQRLTEAQAVARIGSWEVETATQTITWSPETFRLYGFDPAQGEPNIQAVLNRYHPEDRLYVENDMRQAARAGGFFQRDMRLILDDGTLHWLHVTGHSEKNENGAIVRYLGIVQDITERKEAEERVRLSEERYRAMVEASAQMTWIEQVLGVSDPDDRDEMPDWRRFTGQSAEETRGVGWMTALHPDDQERVKKRIAWARETGCPHEVEYRIRRFDGEWRWVRSRAVPVRNQDGSIREWIGVSTDITEARAVEEEQKRRERQLWETLDLMPQLAWIAEADGTLIYLNRRFYEYTGVPEGTPASQVEWMPRIPPADLATALPLLEMPQPSAASDTFEYEHCLRRQDNVWRWHLCRLSAVRDPQGRVERWIGTATDIDDRKEAERERERRAERDRRIAETLQESLLPPLAPDAIPGFDTHALHRPADPDQGTVGGDFHDAFPLIAGRWALVVGDVMGHGLPAALSIAEVRFALRGFLRENAYADPADTLRRLNRFLLEAQRLEKRPRNTLVALTLVVLDPATGRMNVGVAGSYPPLILRGGATPELLDGGGLILGASSDAQYETLRTTLGPGDLLALTTDGIPEALCPGRDEQFGIEGLAIALATPDPGASLAQAAHSALTCAHLQPSCVCAPQHTFRDDICLLLARRHPQEHSA